MDLSSLLSGGTGSVDYAQKQKDMFSSVDTDGDEQFSLEEFTAAAPAGGANGTMTSAEVFDEMDTNEDGYVSQTELLATAPSLAQSSSLDVSESLLGGDMLSQIVEMMGQGENSILAMAQGKSDDDEKQDANQTSASSNSRIMSGQEFLASIQEQMTVTL